MPNILLQTLGLALTITILIELIVLIILRERNIKLLIASIFINIVTNISLNLYIQVIPPKYYDIIVFGLEILVVLFEFICYYLLTKDYKKAIKLSLFCNFTSYIIGIVLLPFIY